VDLEGKRDAPGVAPKEKEGGRDARKVKEVKPRKTTAISLQKTTLYYEKKYGWSEPLNEGGGEKKSPGEFGPNYQKVFVST